VNPVVAFTARNRPAYLKETLSSWSKVRGIGDAHLLFRVEPGCPEVAELCGAADFAKVTVIRNPRRLGVLANPWHAMESGFATGAEFVILAEDDLTVSADVLEFFAWCQRYAADPAVLAVSTHQRDAQPGGLAGVTDARWDYGGAHMWVWGTWADRWERLLRPGWDFTYEENGGGPAQRGWDWKIRNHWVMQQGMRVVAPSLSRSQHIGEHGGAHCTPEQYEDLKSRCYVQDVPPQDYQEVPGG
jgi:hypothetical protein